MLPFNKYMTTVFNLKGAALSKYLLTTYIWILHYTFQNKFTHLLPCSILIMNPDIQRLYYFYFANMETETLRGKVTC